MPAQPTVDKGLIEIPDSLKDDRRGMQRLEVMVYTVLERMMSVDDQQDRPAAGHAT
jgi:hypothetical protein